MKPKFDKEDMWVLTAILVLITLYIALKEWGLI